MAPLGACDGSPVAGWPAPAACTSGARRHMRRQVGGLLPHPCAGGGATRAGRAVHSRAACRGTQHAAPLGPHRRMRAARPRQGIGASARRRTHAERGRGRPVLTVRARAIAPLRPRIRGTRRIVAPSMGAGPARRAGAVHGSAAAAGADALATTGTGKRPASRAARDRRGTALRLASGSQRPPRGRTATRPEQPLDAKAAASPHPALASRHD